MAASDRPCHNCGVSSDRCWEIDTSKDGAHCCGDCNHRTEYSEMEIAAAQSRWLERTTASYSRLLLGRQ